MVVESRISRIRKTGFGWVFSIVEKPEEKEGESDQEEDDDEDGFHGKQGKESN